MDENTIKNLIRESVRAKANAYCLYSHYPVGAALLTAEGNVFTGCNIENASFSPTICAERTAIFKAVSEGYRDFRAIAVSAGNGENFPSPCGVCRQVMREFGNVKEFEIILAKNEEEYRIVKLEDLLPDSFGPEYIEK